MSRIKVFISYSSKDKHFASNIVDCFERCVGFEMFLAHDDLFISDNFPKEIVRHIIEADFIVPLVSKNFLTSTYANQEIGIAFDRKKKIIPISVDGTDPKGFIQDLHAFKCSNWYSSNYIDVVTQVFFLSFKHPKFLQFREKATESIIYAFCKTNHFKITSITLSILIKLDQIIKLGDEQVGKIVAAATKNPQIYSAELIFPKLVEFLRNSYGINIDK